MYDCRGKPNIFTRVRARTERQPEKPKSWTIFSYIGKCYKLIFLNLKTFKMQNFPFLNWKLLKIILWRIFKTIVTLVILNIRIVFDYIFIILNTSKKELKHDYSCNNDKDHFFFFTEDWLNPKVHPRTDGPQYIFRFEIMLIFKEMVLN